MLLKLGYQSETITFNTLIHDHCIKGEVENTLNLSESCMLLKLGYQPDIITFNTLIHDYCIKGEFENTVNLLEKKMVSLGFRTYQITYGILVF